MRAPYTEMVTSPELVVVKFRFQVQAAGGGNHPDVLRPASQGVTDVVNISAGVYDIYFAEKYPVFLGMVGTVLEATPAHDLIVKCSVAGYSATTGILRVTVVGADGSTAAEEPADNDWVYIEATFCRRNQLVPSGSI